MKYINILPAAALLVGLVSVNAYALATKLPESLNGPRVSVPKPLTVVSPTGLPRDFAGATVSFAFTVDEKGVPHNIVPEGKVPERLTFKLVPVLAQWRFTPATVNGVAVPMRVVLPIELRAES